MFVYLLISIHWSFVRRRNPLDSPNGYVDSHLFTYNESVESDCHYLTAAIADRNANLRYVYVSNPESGDWQLFCAATESTVAFSPHMQQNTII